MKPLADPADNPNGHSNRRPSLLARFRRRQFSVSRRLLHSWIRPTIIGNDATTLNLGADDDVCYVLPYRSLADLLVVDKACEAAGLPQPSAPLSHLDEQHRFFFLGRAEGALGRKTQRHHSERMLRLLDHQAQQPQPIKIVPVSLFWGHQPDRENSLWKLLFSENWTATTRLKKLLAIIFHSKHILVEFSAPVSLSDIIRDSAEPDLQVRKLTRILRVHFTQQKQAIIGPDLSHRRTLISAMMESSPVRSAILAEAQAKDIDVANVEARALTYANEIAAHQSYRVIRFFHIILTWLWHKLYNGIEINNIAQVKELARENEIVYTPCHRSHIDYLLLSYVLYHNGLTPPHIAAGKNLNMPLVGPLLRRAGAFFMRRSFQGDALYKSVFDEYLHLMFTRGYSVEYFIEGSRSRTGRTLNPRTGMLTMTISSFRRDASKPICFMPVYFGYEKILEDTTYLNELSGAEKKSESILDIFRVLRSLKNNFGKVTVNFGEPLHLQPFLSRELPNWSLPDNNSRDVNDAVKTLARQLAQSINGAVAINPVNLVATVLLATPRHTIEEARLISKVETLMLLAQRSSLGDWLSVTELSAAEIVREAESVTGLQRSHKPFGDVLFAPPPLPALLTYYRNNTVHVYALPALITRLARLPGSSLERIESTIALLYPLLRAELFLPWEPTALPTVIDEQIRVVEELGLIERDGAAITPPPLTSDTYANALALGNIMEPTLERYFIVNSLLEQAGEQTLADLEASAAVVGHRLSVFYGINAPEFFDKHLFTTLFATLQSTGAISRENNMVNVLPGFEAISKSVQATLDEDIQVHVLALVREQH